MKSILASRVFRKKKGPTVLLPLIVNAAFKKHRVKQEEIALALGKGPTFHAGTDATARSAVGRLRSALRQYYGSEGALEPIRIEIEEGGYFATFSRAGSIVEVSQESREPYNNAPAPQENFVSRAAVHDSMRNALLVEGSNRAIAITALQGMGGIGKTALAVELCHDHLVQQAFPDGIFWFTIGKESGLDFASRVKSVPGLEGLLGEYEGAAACLSQYRSVLRGKAVLVVLDDIWQASDVELFKVEAPRSRLLITTRNLGIAAAFGAREFTANLLTPSESQQVLARWSGGNVDDLPAQAIDLIDECGRLPLALAMIGAQLRGKTVALWKIVLGHLRKADLNKIRALFPEPHTSLYRAIQVSVDALDEVDQRRYRALAVLLEDMPAAPVVQQTLWNVDESEALETAERFVGLSLAQRAGDTGAIHLHDLQLDFIRTQYPDRGALNVIHGAVRLSLRVIQTDAAQFASQLVGRLLSHKGRPAIAQFIAAISRSAPGPWLRPLEPVLDTPDLVLFPPLIGHHSGVNTVAMSGDGRLAVSASLDETLKVWDLESGSELKTLRGHNGCVYSVAMSTDGRLAVSASQDTTLKVWNLETGQVTHTLEGHTFPVGGVALSPDGRRAISGSWDMTVKIWDLETGREIGRLDGHTKSINGVAASADWKRAVSASEDGTLRVWDLEAGEELHTLEGHSDDVWAVAISADGRLAVSGSEDATVKVWDLQTGRVSRTLKGHAWPVYGVAISTDGRFAVSASGDETLKVWNLQTWELLRTLEGHAAAVFGVTLSPDGRLVVSASEDTTLKVWDLETGRVIRTVEGHCKAANGLAVSAGGAVAVVASSDKTLRVLDPESRREVRMLVGHSSFVYDVAVSADGRSAISASGDNTLKVWNLQTGRALRTLSGHSSTVWSVALSADGRLAVSASEDGTVRVWEVMSGREIRRLDGHTGSVYAVAVSADGRRAISSSTDLTVSGWDLKTGRQLFVRKGHSEPVNGLAINTDGSLAVSACDDWTLRMWDVESGRLLRTLEGHSDAVNRVALTPDGAWAASASWDKTLKVWNLRNGSPESTFTCDAAMLCCGFISVNKLIGGDHLGRIHFLSRETGHEFLK
jgi:WD40 repeat protein